MNIELSESEIKVIWDALHRQLAHDSKLLDTKSSYSKDHRAMFNESIIENAKNEWEIINKQLIPKLYNVKKEIKNDR